MNQTIRTACLAAALSLALGAQAAVAQQTMPPGMHIPNEAKVAIVEFSEDGQLTLNGKTARLSGASQIRGTTNLIVLSQALRGKYRMCVLLDESGSIHRAWIVPNN